MVFGKLFGKLKGAMQKLGKKRTAAIAAATAVAVFITSYVLFINPLISGLTGYAIQDPAEEEMLSYGEAIQIKSDYFNNFLSATGAADNSGVNMQVNACSYEQWIIARAENKTGRVKFGDKVYFKSAQFGNYLTQDNPNRKVLVIGHSKANEVWQIVNTFDTSSEDEVCILDPIFIKSVQFKNYLSAGGYDPNSKAAVTSDISWINPSFAPGAWQKWEIQPYQYYSKWMTFSTKIHDKPLREITFPAAHDAGAAGFSNTLATCGDTEQYKSYVNLADSIKSFTDPFNVLGVNFSGFATSDLSTTVSDALDVFYPKTKGLATATDLSIGDQLRRGVRWLDLRVNLRKGSSNTSAAYIYHSLISQNMDDVLSQIKSFLSDTQSKSGEIVVLELGHFADDYDDNSLYPYDMFMQSVFNKLGDSVYSCDKSVNPMNLKYNQVVSDSKSKVILLTDVADLPKKVKKVVTNSAYNPETNRSLFTYAQLAIHNSSGKDSTGNPYYSYSGKTSLSEMTADQTAKFAVAQKKGDIYTAWYTLTGTEDEYTAIVANPMIKGIIADLALRILPGLNFLKFPGVDVRGEVRDFLSNKLFDSFNYYDEPDYDTLRELSQRLGGHARETFEKNFQSLYNPYGHNDMTVLYFDAFYYNTDCIDVAIAYSRLPQKGKEGKSLYNEVGIDSGELYYIKNKATGLYLDVNSGTDADGTKVQQWTSNGTKAQQWRVKYNDGNGLYSIESTAAPDRVLDVYSNDEKLDGKLDVWTDRGAPGMLFALEPAGDTSDEGATYRILTGCSNFKLAVAAEVKYDKKHKAYARDGDAVTQNSKKTNQSDEWEFIKVQVPPPNPKYTEQSAIKDGGVYYIINRNSEKYLDVDAGADTNAAKVQQWDYNGGNNQKWQINYMGDGLYEFVPYYGSSPRALDVLVPDGTEGGKVDVWRKNLTSSMRFALEPVHYLVGHGIGGAKVNTAYIIRSQCSNFTKALNVQGASGNNGANVIQYTHDENSKVYNDEWIIKPVPGFQPTYTGPVDIKNGGKYNIKTLSAEKNKWKYLYVNDGQDKAGSEANLENKNNASDQIWQAVSADNGLYEFHPFGGSANTLTVTTANNLEYKSQTPYLYPTYPIYQNLLHINPDVNSPGQRFALAPVPGESSFYLLPQCADFKQAIIPYKLAFSFLSSEWAKTAMANLSGKEQYAKFVLEEVK